MTEHSSQGPETSTPAEQFTPESMIVLEWSTTCRYRQKFTSAEWWAFTDYVDLNETADLTGCTSKTELDEVADFLEQNHWGQEVLLDMTDSNSWVSDMDPEDIEIRLETS